MFLDGRVATCIARGSVKGKNRRVEIAKYKTSKEEIVIMKTKTLQDRAKRIFYYQEFILGEEAFRMVIEGINGINKEETK